MNIFYLDRNPVLCARYHTDRHVVKMAVESAQILCSVYYFTGQPERSPYKLAHPNHPCCVWVRESLSNWLWLQSLGLALCDEYTWRYGKIHACQAIIGGLEAPALRDIGLTPVRYAFDSAYVIGDDPVENYRNYYMQAKSHLFRWKNREIPFWVTEHQVVQGSPEKQ